ncbi:MAG: NTP transferase domain-containing protein [Bacilli bacterium]|nr:NTP transferase domain-containing protein [Bacilli bacterium]
MKAIIFNSGLGKRMGDFTNTHHKSMAVLNNGETIFERQIRILGENGINEFIVTTGPFKEQIESVSKKFPEYKFTFVENPIYDKTNYIYSMFLASEHLNDDFLLLHGDLVFDTGLVKDMLEDDRKSLCLINEEKALPEKDFKGRIEDGKLREVSINIFDADCFAFQPLYKLCKKDLLSWVKQVANFVKEGTTGVYAENALNTILKDMNIYAKSYSNNYIDEIDNLDDYARVTREIEEFDNKKIQKRR